MRQEPMIWSRANAPRANDLELRQCSKSTEKPGTEINPRHCKLRVRTAHILQLNKL